MESMQRINGLLLVWREIGIVEEIDDSVVAIFATTESEGKTKYTLELLVLTNPLVVRIYALLFDVN